MDGLPVIIVFGLMFVLPFAVVTAGMLAWVFMTAIDVASQPKRISKEFRPHRYKAILSPESQAFEEWKKSQKPK